MKPLQKIHILEWRAARDRLLDAYVEATAETGYSRWFIRRVWEMTEGFRRLAGGINLKCMNPIIVLATSDIVDEIVALHRIADNITHFLNEHCDAVACVFYPDGFDCTCHYAADTDDPYNENVYSTDELHIRNIESDQY